MSLELCNMTFSTLKTLCDRFKFNKLTLTVVSKGKYFLVLDKDNNKPILLISCPKDGSSDPLSLAYLQKAVCDAQEVKKEFGATPFIATISPSISAVFMPIENMCKPLTLEDLSTILTHYRLTIIPTNENEFKKLLEALTKGEASKERRDIQSYLVTYLRDYVIKELADYLEKNKNLFLEANVLSRLNDEAKRIGYRNGITTDPNAKDSLLLDNLLKMMAYVLVDKIIFYKILENYYNINRLMPLYKSGVVRTSREYLARLNEYFENAIVTTGNFDVIFETGIYDHIQFGDDDEAAKILDSLIELVESLDVDQFTRVVGYVYEYLIPPEERHRLGQFYTPLPIVKLITKWAIRGPDYKVLDPGTGSGTFLAEAYDRLFFLRTGMEIDVDAGVTPTETEHRAILRNLYAVDINPFAAHLTAMRLSLKAPNAPSRDMNVIVSDFFKIKPGQVILQHKDITFADFDAVIGNPPYTSWRDLSEDERDTVKSELREVLREYNLMPRNKNVPLYVHWVIHAERFLKEHGKLGMIISNNWLRADYGKDFGKYLLDHFKIKALIDVSQKIFDAIITTVILLAEKESDEKARNGNRVLIARIVTNNGREINEALDCISKSLDDKYEFNEEKLKNCHGVKYKFLKQSEIPTDEKWTLLLFESGAYYELERLVKEGKLIRLGNWFEPSYGNTTYLCLVSWGLSGGMPNYGAKVFFEFNEKEKTEGKPTSKGIIKVPEDCLFPAILDSNEIKTFIFTREDWEALRSKGKNAYLFVCHKPIDDKIKNYIEWGENECKNERGNICSESSSAKARENEKSVFYGWYDLGGIIPGIFMAKRNSQYYPQFSIIETTFATYNEIVMLIPKININFYTYNIRANDLWKMMYDYSLRGKKVRDNNVIKKIFANVEDTSEYLSAEELKALAAYLNSTLVWSWLEYKGGGTSGGALQIELNLAREIPIINVKTLRREDVSELSNLLDELDKITRSNQNLKALDLLNLTKSIRQKIDKKIIDILGLNIDVEELWNNTIEMMNRRLAGTKRSKIHLGEDIPVEEAKSKKRRSRKSTSLEDFI